MSSSDQTNTEQQNADPFLVNPAKESALRELCAQTGYNLVQENGQRKYGGPPPGWNNDPVPGKGSEIFVGKLPRDLYEDELVPVLEKCGRIYELRLMMDFNGNNRGFAFVKYCVQNDAKRALKELNNLEIRKGRLLGVCKSVDNCRLFVGGIPKTKQKMEILAEMQKLTEGVVNVIVYPSAVDKTKNRGFAFVEYQDHHTAAMARRKMMHSRPQVWGHPIAVDWAEPEVEVDEDVMATVKILYIRNLMLNSTEESLEKEFLNIVEQSDIERVKKIRDYAFVHLNTRDNALKCMKALNGKPLDGVPMEVTLAKPVDRETYVRYTRAANRQTVEVTAAAEQLTATYPIIAYDPSTAMYSTYTNQPLYYSTLQHAAAAQPVGLQPGLTVPGLTQIGAAGVPLGIPGATAGIPANGLQGARNLTARGRFRPTGTNRTFAGRGYLNLGRGYPMTYYNNRRPMWQVYQPTQVAHTESQVQAEKYDLLPGMELIPINQLYIKPNQLPKSSVQLLEEMCAKRQIGTPEYNLHSVVGKNGRPLFLYRVSLPPLDHINLSTDNNQRSDSPNYSKQPQHSPPDMKEPQQQASQQFTPTKLSTSLDAAKEIAAEYVFQILDSEDNPDSPNSQTAAENPTIVNPTSDVSNAVYVNPQTVPMQNQTTPSVVYAGQTYFPNHDHETYTNFSSDYNNHDYIQHRPSLIAARSNYEAY